ncbi:MAG: hypothetical protein Q7T25_11325, partial [Sideroxyarcus sp.]|nr:hypothetical protein [Sideroxyarcus sp.]
MKRLRTISLRRYFIAGTVVIGAVLLATQLSQAANVGTRVWSLVASSVVLGDDIHRKPYIQQAVSGGVENGNYHTFWMVANRSTDTQNRIYWRPYNNSGAIASAKLVAGGSSSPAGAVNGPTTLPMADDTGGVYFSYGSSIGGGPPAKSYVKHLTSDGTTAWTWSSPDLPSRMTNDTFH